MKLAIDSFSFHLHLGKHWYIPSKIYDLKWYCEKCLEYNVNGLHIDPMHINPLKDKYWLKEFITDNNLYIELGGIGTSINELSDSIKTASFLGSKILRIFVGGSCSEGKETVLEKVKSAKKNLSESIRLAEDNDVILALENHGDLFIDDIQRLLEIESGYLGLCFDTGNFRSVGEDPLFAIKLFKERVVCTHLKDAVKAGKYPDAESYGIEGHKVHFCALGEGEIPLKEIVKIIRESKEDDFGLTLEIHTPYRKNLNENELLNLEIENASKSVKYARENF